MTAWDAEFSIVFGDAMSATTTKPSAPSHLVVTQFGPPVESPDATMIVRPTDPPIINSFSELWTLTGNGQCAVNGVVDTSTANVVLLFYWKHLLFQQNKAGGWWSKMVASAPWNATTAPAGLPKPPAPPPPVTHLTVMAALDAFRQMPGTSMDAASLAALTKIRADVGTLTP